VNTSWHIDRFFNEHVAVAFSLYRPYSTNTWKLILIQKPWAKWKGCAFPSAPVVHCKLKAALHLEQLRSVLSKKWGEKSDEIS